jgi:hypothetical protein
LPAPRPARAASLALLSFRPANLQDKTIESKWPHILLIAVPLTLQTYISFIVAYGLCYAFGVSWRIAAPAAFISSSNFFELAIAVALSAYGLDSGATLATTVGVLTEVPVMLSLVAITKATRHWFERRDQAKAAAEAEAEIALAADEQTAAKDAIARTPDSDGKASSHAPTVDSTAVASMAAEQV